MLTLTLTVNGPLGLVPDECSLSVSRITNPIAKNQSRTQVKLSNSVYATCNAYTNSNGHFEKHRRKRMYPKMFVYVCVTLLLFKFFINVLILNVT